MVDLFRLARPLLQRLDAERAHRLTIEGLKRLPFQMKPWQRSSNPDPRLAVEALGLHFPTPLGLAAGFDKDGEVANALLGLGFGFVELGGVTPRPQPGNVRPRVFRLARDRAVINRYGLNSAGGEAMLARLADRDRRYGLVGINIGANKEALDRVEDYASLVRQLADVTDYISVNISSPNTPGLRALQDRTQLDDLLTRVMAAREKAAGAGQTCPILVKIAPDMAEEQLDDVIEIAKARGVNGLIIANTTIARPGNLIEKTLAIEAGGLSGRPLFTRSTQMLARAYLKVEGAFPLIGVGGIDSAETAWAKIEAGASLLQLYTALIFEGTALIGRIHQGLSARLEAEQIMSIGAVTGRKAREWAARKQG